MKKRFAVLLVVGLMCTNVARSQVRSGGAATATDDNQTDVSNPAFKPKLSLGVGVGFSNLYGNLPTSSILPAGRIGIGCRLTKALIVGIEAFGGQLGSSLGANDWTPGIKETSNFEAADLNAKITIGNYLNYPNSKLMQILTGVYVGSGIGFVHSSITSFSGKFTSNYREYNLELSKGSFRQNSVSTPYVPLNVGIRIPMKRFLGFDNSSFMLNYQINNTFSNYVDGWSFSSSTSKNQYNNVYTVITIGFSFYLTKD